MFDPKHNDQFKLLDKFLDLHRISKVWQQCTIKAKRQADDDHELYDYIDHYLVKDMDASEHRFCSNTYISKSYELTLQRHAGKLIPDMSDFLWEVKIPQPKRQA